MKRCILMVLLFMCLSASVVQAKEPVKIIVIPSVLNMFIQYNTLMGVFHEDPYLFEDVIRDIKEHVALLSEVQYSALELGQDDEAANALMLNGPYPEKKERYDADILFLIGNADDTSKVEVFAVGVESGRATSIFIDKEEISNLNLSEKLIDAITRSLEYREELLTVKAEKIVDPKNSVIQYEIPSLMGNHVLVQVGYDRAHQQIQSIDLLSDAMISNGEKMFQLESEDGHTIEMTYSYEDGVIRNVHFDSDYRELNEIPEGSKEFRVLSKKGFPLKFRLSWKADKIVHATLFPEENPYAPQLVNEKE